MAQVPYETARSNLGSYVEASGLSGLASSLPENVDVWATIIGLGAMFAAAIGAIYVKTSVPNLLKLRTNASVPSLLKNHRWILYHNPKLGRKKEISFLDNGQIGEGGNQNETVWSLRGDELIIHRQNGDLQNRFKYDPSSHKFVCIKDTNAKGLEDQYIQRVD